MWEHDRGAALMETAIVLPVIVLLLVGALIIGIAQVEDLRIERATLTATRLSEPGAQALVSSVGGTVTCYWKGEGPGGCFDDGLDVDRVQVMSRGRTWQYPTGSVTPTARASRPTPTTTEVPNENG